MRLLLIDDNQDDRALALRELNRSFPDLDVTQVQHAAQFEAALQAGAFEAVVTDFQLGWSTGLDILHRIKHLYPDCPVVMFTATATQEQAVEAMKSGLDDYVLKSPKHYMRLPAALTAALARSRAIVGRRAAEQELRRREAWMTASLECIGEGVITTDLSARVQSINPQAERLTGWNSAEALGRDVDHVLNLTDSNGHILPESPVRQAIREERSTVADRNDYCLVDRSGNSIAVIDGASPIYVNGTIEGIVVALRDISDRKHMERELLRSNDELQQFAYAASHDLQEPLRTVIVFTQLLAKRMDGNLTPEQERYMNFVQEAGKRMSAQIAGLLRHGAMQRDAEVEVLPLNEVVNEVAEDLHAYIEQRSGRVESSSLPSVRASRPQIHTVFQNLISNGLKYNENAHPAITIEMRETPEGRLLAISDNGIGIALPYREKVFGLFSRLEPNRYSGSGIGLSSVRRAVERMGGHIWVDPLSQDGTTFLIKLNWIDPAA